MCKFKILTQCILLITMPSLLAYPRNNPPCVTASMVNYEPDQNMHHVENRSLTYDEVLNFLDELESGELEKKCSPEDLERINLFIALLAKKGVLPDDLNEEMVLEDDVEDLLDGGDTSLEYAFWTGMHADYIIVPAVFNDYDNSNVILCNSWVKKKWRKTKKFVTKHKKEIIIGAVVVVAATVIVVAVVAASSAGAVAAAAGAAGTAVSSPDKEEKSKSESNGSSSSIPNSTITQTPSHDAPLLKTAIDKHVFSFKEFIVEDKIAQQLTPFQVSDDLSFGEKARELGAHLAHQAYDEFTELVSVIPQLCEEIKEVGSKFLPESLTLPNDVSGGSPTENYEDLVTKGHKVIDRAFSSDQADLYTAEAKVRDLRNDFSIGLIPLPGIFSGGGFNTKKLAEAGKAIDKAGFTKAGRNLMKHGYRDGSVFPKPIGNPAQVNAHGQKVLESILNHPEKKLISGEFSRFGKVVDIYAPGIGGARYSAAGEFIGFLEL